MTDLHVCEWGSADGFPLLFSHALGPEASGEAIAEIAPVLAARGFRVVAFDGPGFGRSPLLPPERYASPALAVEMPDAADERGLDRFVLMGHSWGGTAALACAAAAPERVAALVLVDSGHIEVGSLPDVPDRTVDEWVAQAEQRGLRGRLAQATGRAMWALAAQPVSAYWPVVVKRSIPTLLLLATEPPQVEENREHLPWFVAALPHAEIRWVPGARHGLLADVGAPLGNDLADWLAAIV